MMTSSACHSLETFCISLSMVASPAKTVGVARRGNRNAGLYSYTHNCCCRIINTVFWLPQNNNSASRGVAGTIVIVGELRLDATGTARLRGIWFLQVYAGTLQR